jgi:hypothetical protein
MKVLPSVPAFDAALPSRKLTLLMGRDALLWLLPHWPPVHTENAPRSRRQKMIALVEGDQPIREGWRERLAEGVVETEPVKKWEGENHAGM